MSSIPTARSPRRVTLERVAWLALAACAPSRAAVPSVAATPHAADTLATAAPAARRAITPCDSGAFTLALAGAPAGSERFAMHCLGDGRVAARGETRLRFAGVTADVVTTIALDSALLPETVTVVGTANGAPMNDTLRFRGDSALLIRGGQRRAIPIARGASYAGNNVLFIISLLAARYDAAKGGAQRIPAFPNAAATVTHEGRDAVRPAGDSVAPPTPFERYGIALGPSAITLWADARGRTALMWIPSQRFDAVRDEYARFVEALHTAARQTAAAPAPPDYGAPPGAPYTAQEVTVPAGGVALAGTLLLPKAGRPPFPAVITVTGSGQQTRDEPLPLEGLEAYRPFRQVAETLAASGIAVLRVDDRGVGGSTGRETLPRATTDTFAADVRAQVAYLRSRREIDPNRIAIVGHSEGGVIAPLVAAADPRIAAIVLLAGTGKRGDSVLVDQLEDALSRNSLLSDSMKAVARATQQGTFRQLREGKDVLGLSGVAWWRWWLDYDPLATIRRVRQPILILQGANDRQVTAEQAAALERAARAAGNRDVAVRVFPTLNHLFLPSTTGAVEEYGSLSTTSMPPEVLGLIRDWLVRHLGAAAAGGR